jgi:hypothetical protein
VGLFVGLLLLSGITGCQEFRTAFKNLKDLAAPPPKSEEKGAPKTMTSPALGATQEQKKPKPPPPFVHRVQWPGESLSIIAKWYTGRLDNWKALSKANPKLNPKRIRIGNEIRIPNSLMVTQDPMPKEFLQEFVSEKERPAKPSKKPSFPEDDKEIELFPPKELPKD